MLFYMLEEEGAGHKLPPTKNDEWHIGPEVVLARKLATDMI
jgi:hypothetical protein